MKTQVHVGGTAALTAASPRRQGALPAAADDALTEPPPAPGWRRSRPSRSRNPRRNRCRPGRRGSGPASRARHRPQPTVDLLPPSSRPLPAPVEQAVAEVQQQTIEYDTPKPDEPKWVFVCKYAGKPGVGRAYSRAGNNPISVSR